MPRVAVDMQVRGGQAGRWEEGRQGRRYGLREPVQRVRPLTAEWLLRPPLGTDCICLYRPQT